MLNPNSYAIITGKNQWSIQTDRDLQGTLTWTCLEPSLETFCLKPWNLLQRLLGTLIYLEHGNLFLEPLLAWNLHWKSLAWNLETLEPHASLSWREPLGTSTWNLEPFDTFWNLHLEPVLETRNLYWMLAWNFRAFRNLAFTWNSLLEPLLGTLTWNLGTWNLLEFWNFPGPFLGSLSCLEPSLETWPWTSTWTPYWNLATFQNQTVLGTFQTCTWNPCICGPPGSFTCNLEPRNFTWNPYWKPSKLLGPLFGILTWSLGTFRNFT